MVLNTRADLIARKKYLCAEGGKSSRRDTFQTGSDDPVGERAHRDGLCSLFPNFGNTNPGAQKTQL